MNDENKGLIITLHRKSGRLLRIKYIHNPKNSILCSKKIQFESNLRPLIDNLLSYRNL